MGEAKFHDGNQYRRDYLSSSNRFRGGISIRRAKKAVFKRTKRLRRRWRSPLDHHFEEGKGKKEERSTFSNHCIFILFSVWAPDADGSEASYGGRIV